MNFSRGSGTIVQHKNEELVYLTIKIFVCFVFIILLMLLTSIISRHTLDTIHCSIIIVI